MTDQLHGYSRRTQHFDIVGPVKASSPIVDLNTGKSSVIDHAFGSGDRRTVVVTKSGRKLIRDDWTYKKIATDPPLTLVLEPKKRVYRLMAPTTLVMRAEGKFHAESQPNGVPLDRPTFSLHEALALANLANLAAIRGFLQRNGAGGPFNWEKPFIDRGTAAFSAAEAGPEFQDLLKSLSAEIEEEGFPATVQTNATLRLSWVLAYNCEPEEVEGIVSCSEVQDGYLLRVKLRNKKNPAKPVQETAQFRAELFNVNAAEDPLAPLTQVEPGGGKINFLAISLNESPALVSVGLDGEWGETSAGLKEFALKVKGGGTASGNLVIRAVLDDGTVVLAHLEGDDKAVAIPLSWSK